MVSYYDTDKCMYYKKNYLFASINIYLLWSTMIVSCAKQYRLTSVDADLDG